MALVTRQAREGAVAYRASRPLPPPPPHRQTHTQHTRPAHAYTAARLQFGANILVMGDDHTGRFAEVENEGCSRVFLERTAGVSTSERLMFIACGE